MNNFLDASLASWLDLFIIKSHRVNIKVSRFFMVLLFEPTIISIPGPGKKYFFCKFKPEILPIFFSSDILLGDPWQTLKRISWIPLLTRASLKYLMSAKNELPKWTPPNGSFPSKDYKYVGCIPTRQTIGISARIPVKYIAKYS